MGTMLLVIKASYCSTSVEFKSTKMYENVIYKVKNKPSGIKLYSEHSFI